jgi:hypothetical protein
VWSADLKTANSKQQKRKERIPLRERAIAPSRCCIMLNGIFSMGRNHRSSFDESTTDINFHKIHVTFFYNAFASEALAKNLTLPELCDLILQTKGKTKSALPWLKGAKFGNKKNVDEKGKGNCLRWDGNVIGFDLIELDYDGEKISFDEAVATLKAMNVRFLIYTSPSHTDAAPRWRILLPVSGKLPLEMRAKLCARVNGKFNGIFALESFTLSQSYYYGLALDNPVPHHRAEVHDGRMINLCDDLFRFEKNGWPKSKKVDDEGDDNSDGDGDGDGLADFFEHAGDQQTSPRGFDAHLARLGDGEGLDGFNDPLTRAAAAYATVHGKDLDRDELKKKLRDAINDAPKKKTRKPEDITRYLSDKYLDDIIASSIKKFSDSEKKAEKTRANLLAEMNKKYSIVRDGSKVNVLMFDVHTKKIGRHEHTRQIATFLSFFDFRNLHSHRTVFVRDAKNKIHAIPLGDWWLKNPKRKQYAGIVFEPGGKEVIGNRLNLWKGFGVAPIKGDWSLMKAHIKEVMCSSNAEYYTYVFNWLAWCVQNPAKQAEVALVFRGKRGTGKGTLGNCMCKLFGQHGIQISNAKHLTGFNAHLRDACFMFADEAYWPGDKKAEGDLKRLVTEPSLNIEAKGRDAVPWWPNMLHVMMAGNEDWIVPAGERERRWAFFDVLEIHIQDEAWFTAINKQLDDGGYGAMLYDLLHHDLGDFHPRRLPKMSDAIIDQQSKSLSPLDTWWVQLLETGVLEGADPLHPNRAVSNSYDREVDIQTGYGTTGSRIIKQRGLFDQARSIEPRLRVHGSDHALGNFLRDQGCSNKNRILRRHGWTFPPLDVLRKQWEARFPGWKWHDPDLSEWRFEGSNLTQSVDDDDE